MFSFEVIAKEGEARAGRLVTPRGVIETPSFVPVGTLATVKAVTPEDLREIGSQVVITNAFHLHLRPGEDLISRMGGLHRFMHWDGPLIMDSGGFQIFSLGAGKEHGVGKIAPIFPDENDPGGHYGLGKKPLVTVDEDGVEFISYLDGSIHRFTPESVIEIGRKLDTDVILVLDECTSPLHDFQYTRRAMERTHRWAQRAIEAFELTSDGNQALWGIVQGGAYQDLREESAAFIVDKNFDGFAIGGSLGKSKNDMHQVLEWAVPYLPEQRPRHLLGIGKVEDIFEVVRRGIDFFDCVAPTKLAHTGTLFTRDSEGFQMHILNAQYKDDPRPIEEGCNCGTCGNYSRGYLRHLFLARELLGIRLAAIHNLSFMESLMGEIRAAIREGRLAALEKEWMRNEQ
jgi:queuine tRNA-ribosyltransferase